MEPYGARGYFCPPPAVWLVPCSPSVRFHRTFKGPVSYSDKYEDPRWKALRVRLFHSEQYLCNDCGNCHEGGKGLELHHCWYEYGKEPWDYPDDCFLVLCRKCHGTRQKIQNSALVVLGQLSRLLSVDELKVLTFELVAKKADLQRNEVFEL